MTTDLTALLHADDVETWSDEVDVVVVGFGIAGACAALEAARAGASVVLLERGGVRRHQVQREYGSVIEGLYAAGACAVTIARDGKSYASGTQLAEGSYFGRRAGRHAAADAR